MSLPDPGVAIKNNFALYLRNSSYSRKFMWIGKPEMVCLSHWVDMFQIIFPEISASMLGVLYYLNYSRIPLPNNHAKSSKSSIIDGFYDSST
jgi:hypothetical protein